MATVLAFHAHPDDEAILTGGTLARAVAEGHRVIVVVATDGVVDPETEPMDIRMDELRTSAAALGVHRVEHLGYADSGYGPVFHPDPPGRIRFARADTDAAAERLAAVLHDERADLLLSYEANGGYGHRDHLKVHEVGKRAAELAGTPRVLEATMPRELLLRLQRVARTVRLPGPYENDPAATLYTPNAVITHRIDVRRFAGNKRKAFSAHRTQLVSPNPIAQFLLRLFLLPNPLFGVMFGHEWFVDPDAEPGAVVEDDIFGVMQPID